MKIEIDGMPPTFKETWPGQYKIFSWVEFVTAVQQTISVI